MSLIWYHILVGELYTRGIDAFALFLGTIIDAIVHFLCFGFCRIIVFRRRLLCTGTSRNESTPVVAAALAHLGENLP